MPTISPADEPSTSRTGTVNGRFDSRLPARAVAALVLATVIIGTSGCYSFRNSWLDPSQVGNFLDEGTLEIRSSLSIQDAPIGIAGASEPTPEDLIAIIEPYRLECGDTANVRIFELFAENTETAVQVILDEEGMIGLPLLGRIPAAGLTASELEDELSDILRQRDILRDPNVIVEAVLKRGQSYSIFGAIPNPSVYPISQPDLNLIEAVSFAGGLIDTVTEIYVIRKPPGPTGPAFTGRHAASRRPHLAAHTPDVGAPLVMSDGFSDGPAAAAQRPAGEPPQSQPAEETSPLKRLLGDEEAEQEIIDAVFRGKTKTKPPPAPTQPDTVPATTPAIESPVEPAAQPRFIFLNGKWIEVEPPPATQPQPVVETMTQPQPPPLEPPIVPPPPGEAVPVIDWSQIAGDTEPRIIRVSAEALRNGDPRQNIIVRAGDTIRLMAGEVGEYYVMGQVIRPGAYSLTGRRLTLKQAIAAAGNIAPLGWPDRCTIYRRYGDREEMKQVNLDAIFAGKEADLFLKKDDLVLVGTHPAAPFLAVIRNAFRMTYGFGFVYDRNFADRDAYNPKINPDNIPSRFPNLFLR
jgi:protein involved in polysaccharide export with SLBB domain